MTDRVVRAEQVNGISVICETIPFFQSVSFGIWFTAGSVNEEKEKSGLFHFIEHMAFKGTDRMGQREVAVAIDQLGGHINAFTSREATCYSGHVVSERFGTAFDLVADIVLNSTFPENEMERERSVILEEIRMSQDNPSEFIQDQTYEAIWAGHPLGNSITGTKETVENIGWDDLISARERFYKPPGIIITACGGIDTNRLVKAVERCFGNLSQKPVTDSPGKPEYKQSVKIFRKDLEQVHLLLAGPAPPIADSRRGEIAILDNILGSSVSSRLFQRIREEMGLAYMISSFYEQYRSAGFFSIYSACSKEKLIPMIKTIRKEMAIIRSIGPTPEEIKRAITMETDNIIMSHESPASRMYDLAEQKIYFGAIMSLQESLDEIKAVTVKSVKDLSEELEIAGKGCSLLAVGPISDENERIIAESLN